MNKKKKKEEQMEKDLTKFEKLYKETKCLTEKYLGRIDKTAVIICLVVYFLLKKENKK